MRIGELRENLTDALEGALGQGTSVVGWESKKLSVPAVELVPAEPFIDRVGPLTMSAKFATHWLIQLFVGQGDGAEVRRRLDEMVETSIIALDEIRDRNASIEIESADAPLFSTINGTSYTGAEIRLTVAISMKESE